MSNHEFEISAFLERKGAVAVCVRLDPPDGMLYTDLTEVVHVSGNTLSDRLKEGRKMDLFKIGRKAEDHGNSKRNILTDRGEQLRKEMVSVGLDEAYEQYFQANQRIDSGRGEVLDWLQESGITDPRWVPKSDRGRPM
jgi:hypothetical protein